MPLRKRHHVAAEQKTGSGVAVEAFRHAFEFIEGVISYIHEKSVTVAVGGNFFTHEGAVPLRNAGASRGTHLPVYNRDRTFRQAMFNFPHAESAQYGCISP